MAVFIVININDDIFLFRHKPYFSFFCLPFNNLVDIYKKKPKKHFPFSPMRRDFPLSFPPKKRKIFMETAPISFFPRWHD